MLGKDEWADAEFPLYAVERELILSDDFMSEGDDWPGAPVVPLIDLQTMEVLVTDCAADEDKFYGDYIREFL